MPSFTNVGYVWQILEKRTPFCHPLPLHLWAASKRPIPNRVKGSQKFCNIFWKFIKQQLSQWISADNHSKKIPKKRPWERVSCHLKLIKYTSMGVFLGVFPDFSEQLSTTSERLLRRTKTVTTAFPDNLRSSRQPSGGVLWNSADLKLLKKSTRKPSFVKCFVS